MPSSSTWPTSADDFPTAGEMSGRQLDDVTGAGQAHSELLGWLGSAVGNIEGFLGAPVGWTTFTSALFATTTNPDLGATGYCQGFYRLEGGSCKGSIEFEFAGAGLSAGSGSYYWLLPAPYSDQMPSLAKNHIIGFGIINDVSALTHRTVTLHISTNVGSGLPTDASHFIVAPNAGLIVTDSQPWTWASTDNGKLWFDYPTDV
jgi:hypothetical protein